MTTVYCNNSECKFLKNGVVCDRTNLSLNEDGECEIFEDYHNDPEWQTVFWKRMFDRERNIACRVEYVGKELEFGGRVFYVEDRQYYARLTDKETGLKVGTLADINENVDIVGKIKEKAKEWSPLMDLPIALYDEKSRKYSYPDEERSENGKS